MQYRRLGKTEWMVSLVGMGGIPIQKISFAAAEKVVWAAIEAGINFFDTARAYTDSEEKLGRVFGRYPQRQKLFIATKSPALTRDEILKDIEKSLKNLQVDYIDLYQLHNVKEQQALDQVLGPQGAVEGLLEAQERGLVKYLGITGHVPQVLVKAIKTGLFATVQFPFNAVETGALRELLPLAQELDLGCIVMKPLAGGALTDPELALRFLFQYPVSTVIPGMNSLEQVAQNVKIGNSPRELTPEEQKKLQQEVDSLGKTFCRRCEYCLPCPQKINIPTIFLLDGYYTRYGLKDWARQRYAGLEKRAADCIQCGSCEERCPYNLPIRSMLKEASSRFDQE